MNLFPKFEITINGTPVSEGFLSKLVSVTVTDKEGTGSDTVSIDLNDGPPVFNEIPSKDAIITVSGGYLPALSYFGAFSDADVDVDCLPYGMRISAKSADMKSELKKHQERHWDNSTVGGVFSQLAGESGLTAQISPKLASLTFPNNWVAMQNESVLHFGPRIAERIGGLFAIKDGKLIMAEKGSGLKPSGSAMTGLIIRPTMIVTGSCAAHFSAREKVKEVNAEYQDRNEAKRKTVTVSAHPDARQSYTLRMPYGDKDEAERAAQAKAKELSSSADTTSVTIEGNTAARGGAPMTYKGVRPGLDGVPFIIETAAHTFTKSGTYTVNIDAKAKV